MTGDRVPFRMVVPLGEQHGDLTADELMGEMLADATEASVATDIVVDSFGFVDEIAGPNGPCRGFEMIGTARRNAEGDA